MNYFILTYGCQMNTSDSERIATILESAGYGLAAKMERADLIVVNMCSVRQSAVDRVYGKIRDFAKLKTQNSKLKTILTGCILKKDLDKFKKSFDFVIDIKDITKLPGILNKKIKSSSKNYLSVKPTHLTNFIAFVPIITGCNNFCAFCIVPYTRGREISRPAEEIICEIKNLIKRGYKEIWLLGQNVNSYESKLKAQNSKRKTTAQNSKLINFPKLLKMVNNIPGNFWIRFTSSHPKDFSDELIKVMAGGKKITPYLNLPVQAGDDEILRKMNRSYSVAQYKSLVKKIRGKTPGITLSTDIIVGFPGETKGQFENSVKLFKEIKYDMAYIAEYSPRPGTAAAKMEDSVPKKEKARRKKILNNILKKTALEHNKKYLGKNVEVLVDSKKDKNLWLGKTRTHKTVQFASKNNLLGKFIKVKITDVLPLGLKGDTFM